MKLMATPKTIWSPRWVIQANPCTSAKIHGGGYGGAQAEPGRACNRGRRGAAKVAGQHLALEPGVEDSGPLRIEPGQAGDGAGRVLHRHVTAPAEASIASNRTAGTAFKSSKASVDIRQETYGTARALALYD